MVMAMELPVTGEAESPTATDLHRALMASVMLTLMPMVMAMAAALPVTGEVASPTATGLLRVRMASAMPTLMPSALALEDSFVSPAPTPPLASTTMAMVPLLTQSESALLMHLDTVVASLVIGEVAFLTATGPPRVLVPTGVRIFYKTSLYYT